MFGSPLSVTTKRVDPDTSYDDIREWLFAKEEGQTVMETIRENNCVVFIQLGGSDQVLCCVPNPSNPSQGVSHCVRPAKRRGEPGKAVMMVYQ